MKPIKFTFALFLLVTLSAIASSLFGQSTARVQVIHNAADPSAASEDVWLTGMSGSTKLLDDFAFREATPYIDAPAGTPIQLGIAPPTSTMVTDTIANFTVTLTAGETYVVVANGVLSPASFATNPDGASTGFGLFVNAAGQESGTGSNVDFMVFHGSTDAPTVDVEAQGVGTLVNNASYGDFTSYLSVPAASYLLDVKDSSATSTVVTKSADLSTLGDGAAVVFASGFLDPGANGGGPGFGIFAALANGTVVEFSTFVNLDQTSADAMDISAYPNPATDWLTIRIQPNNARSTITLHDIQGKQHFTTAMSPGQTTTEINTSVLPGGLYFITVETNEQKSSQKILIQ